MERELLDAAEDGLLLIPGPTPVPGRVLRAGARGMLNHRGPAFRALLRRVTERLKPAFGTATEPLILTASGTGGLEAAVVNTLSPGDAVLAVVTGAFGRRFADMAAAYGAVVTRLEVEWGRAAAPAEVAAALADGRYAAVLMTLNETSTGVVNPVRELAALAREHGALSLVDAISGLLATPCEVDAWGLDVVVAGSQKAFMIPPGLSFVTMSEHAWTANATAHMPRFYFDLALARRHLAEGENPWTPAVSLVYALDEALAMIEAEGHPAILARHARCRDLVRAGVRELGLEPLAADDCASPAVTAVRIDGLVGADALRSRLRTDHGVELAGGQGPLKGKIVRIGHLGWVDERKLRLGLAALRSALVAAQ